MIIAIWIWRKIASNHILTSSAQFHPEGRHESKAEGECFASFKNLLKNKRFLCHFLIFWVAISMKISFDHFCKNIIFFNFLGSGVKWFWPFRESNFIFLASKYPQKQCKNRFDRIFLLVDCCYLNMTKNRLESHISVKRPISPEGRHESKAEGECFAPFKNWLKNERFFYHFLVFLSHFPSKFHLNHFCKNIIFSIFWVRVWSVSGFFVNQI